MSLGRSLLVEKKHLWTKRQTDGRRPLSTVYEMAEDALADEKPELDLGVKTIPSSDGLDVIDDVLLFEESFSFGSFSDNEIQEDHLLSDEESQQPNNGRDEATCVSDKTELSSDNLIDEDLEVSVNDDGPAMINKDLLNITSLHENEIQPLNCAQDDDQLKDDESIVLFAGGLDDGIGDCNPKGERSENFLEDFERDSMLCDEEEELEDCDDDEGRSVAVLAIYHPVAENSGDLTVLLPSDHFIDLVPDEVLEDSDADDGARSVAVLSTDHTVAEDSRELTVLLPSDHFGLVPAGISNTTGSLIRGQKRHFQTLWLRPFEKGSLDPPTKRRRIDISPKDLQCFNDEEDTTEEFEQQDNQGELHDDPPQHKNPQILKASSRARMSLVVKAKLPRQWMFLSVVLGQRQLERFIQENQLDPSNLECSLCHESLDPVIKSSAKTIAVRLTDCNQHLFHIPCLNHFMLNNTPPKATRGRSAAAKSNPAGVNPCPKCREDQE